MTKLIVLFVAFYCPVLVNSGSVPRVPPSKLRFDLVNVTSITITWQRLQLNFQNKDEVTVHGYNVRYKRSESQSDDFVNMKISGWRSERATLRDLVEDTEYMIQVAAYSDAGVGVYSEALYVMTDQFTKFLCLKPNVSLPQLPPEEYSRVHIRRSDSFLIESEVILDCELSQSTLFTWNIYSYSGMVLVLSRNGSSEFRITPRMLPLGDYVVCLNVSLVGIQMSGVARGFFQVTSSPLIALITGGTKVVRGFNRSLVFDASMSYDPDMENQQLSGLFFTWLCTDISGLERCYNSGGKIESSGSVLTLNSGLMLENSSYFINVKVTKDQRQAEYTQEVFIAPGDPPEVQIRCVDNCNGKVNPSGRIALQGICTGSLCGGTLIYQWSLFKATILTLSNETQWLEITEIQQIISTQLYSKTLVTYPTVLESDERYKFVLTAVRPGGYPGYSENQVITNSPPTGGYCQVSPQSGITLVTEFTFSCADWQDVDLPLQYEFIYFTNSDLLKVVYKGLQPSQHTKLPVGEKGVNSTIDFRVRVADIFGAFTEVKTPVQVVEPTVEDANLVDIAANLTTGANSELTKLIQSGDLSRAFQLATAAIVAVDDNTQTKSQEELTAKRIAMSAVPAETVLRVQQVSNVIAEASSVISEVTVKAQETATDALVTMTSVLKAESLAGENYETILEGSRSLVTGLGSMLRVTSFGAKVYDSQQVYQDSPDYRQRRSTRNRRSLLSDILATRHRRNTIKETSDDDQLQSKVRTEGILNSLDDVGSTILSRTLVGEEPKELSAKSVAMLVARMEPDSLAGSVLASKGSSFTLPLSTELFRNGTQFVDSQVMTTDYVPFSWDASASRVTTKVSSLELKNSSGHAFNITDLKAPILITLPNDRDFTINNSQPHFVGVNRTVYHRINVTTARITLLVKIRPENNASEFVVYGKYNRRPSAVNSDFNKTIPDFSSCVYDHVLDSFVNCSRDPYMVFVDSAHVNQTGYYFIGIQFKSRASGTSRVRRCVGGQGRSKRSCVQYKDPPTTSATYNIPQYLPGDENYTMLVIPAACLYWSTELSKWTTEGCDVAETTDEDAIHCSCNHLSAFGGQLFVAPNPIDFDKVVMEFSRLHETRNVAVIATISCVFGLYLLLLTWARKYDKLDHLKLGERSLLGVRSSWAHFYEIEISTGIWRNSGTTAKVFVMLEGEQEKSRPYQLKVDSYIPFARGSIVSFTLSIPMDIGPIRSVRVWHDNSGSSPSWFLNYIKVFDLSTRIPMTFMCYMWLAVDRGDGLVDRTLTSSTTEKGIDLSVYVQNKIAEEFSDEHLWFSVATRSPGHRFTRVERLSCCLSLLFCDMLVSAMFYQLDTSVENTEGTIRLGRFVFNLREFIIGVQSLFIVLPVNLLIVMIFTHTKSSKEERFGDNLDNQKRKFSLPHWFIYVAWLLCFLASFGPATLVIFYSMQWGKDTSEQWLISIVISLFIEIFVSEPLRIIVIAFLLSHIFKARFQSSYQTPYQTPYHIDPLVDVDDVLLNEKSKVEEDLEIPKPPNKKQLLLTRKNRLRELHMFKALRKIVSYITYLFILVAVCYGGRNEHGFLMTNSVSKVFGNLNEISSHLTTWQWVQEVLLPGLFEDGKHLQNTSRPYIGDGQAVLVGMPRLRQLRVKKDSCKVPFETRNLFNSCVASYSFHNEDETQYYLPKWRLLSSTENVSLSDLDQICPTAWHYASAQQTRSLHFWGRLHPFCIYGRGGFLAELGYDKNAATTVTSELSGLNWINRFTSVVFVEFTVFNSGVSLFTTFTIAVEFSPSGYVVSNKVIRTLHVYDLGGGYNTITIICQVLLVIFIIYFIVTEVKQMLLGLRQYFKQFLNLVELAQTVTVISFVVAHVLKETELFKNTAKLQENVFQFISFDKSVLLNTLESVLVSLLMFFNTLKLLYLLKFNSHVGHLFGVMKRSARELLHCSVGLLVFMLTFIHSGYLSFGKDLEAYSSPFTVLQTLLTEGVIGEGTNDFQDCCIRGRVYMLAFKLGLNFICINFFVAVLNDNYQIVRNLSKKKFSLGLFMIKKMKEILGCVGPQTEAIKQPEISAQRTCTGQKTKEIKVLDLHDSIPTLEVDLDERTKQIKKRLNYIYADEFGDDSDMLRLWLDIHLQRSGDSEASEEDEVEGYCALA